MWCSSERIARILITSIAFFSSLLLPRSYVGCFTAFSPSPRSSITVQIQQKISLTMVQLTLHSKAVNLARRFTVQNEPDMMRKYFSSEALSPFFCLSSHPANAPRTYTRVPSASLRCIRRRHPSSRVEESYVEDDSFDISPQKYTREFCTELSKHLMNEKALPLECYKFRDVVRDLKRRDTDTTHPTSWMT